MAESALWCTDDTLLPEEHGRDGRVLALWHTPEDDWHRTLTWHLSPGDLDKSSGKSSIDCLPVFCKNDFNRALANIFHQIDNNSSSEDADSPIALKKSLSQVFQLVNQAHTVLFMKIKTAITEAVRAGRPDGDHQPQPAGASLQTCGCCSTSSGSPALSNFMKGADGYLSVIEACDEEMRRQLTEENDVQRALAALLLMERVTGPRDRKYREGPNGWQLVS